MEKSKSTINLKVKEIEQSIDFYRCIGFKIPHTETRQFPLRILSEGGNFDLSLIPQDFTSDAEIKDYDLIQVNYNTTLEVIEAYNRTIRHGYKSVSKPLDTFWGTKSAKVVDPNGNNVLLYALSK